MQVKTDFWHNELLEVGSGMIEGKKLYEGCGKLEVGSLKSEVGSLDSIILVLESIFTNVIISFLSLLYLQELFNHTTFNYL